MRTDEEYYDVLGMLGVVLDHAGGKVEVAHETLKTFDLTKKELKTWYNPLTNMFVFELLQIEDEVATE